MSAVAVPPIQDAQEQPPLLKLDIACGAVPQDGFEGVDIDSCGGIVKHVHDLTVFPWPFETSSADEMRCSHFLEHLDGSQRIDFMNELWRILKPGAGCLITTPFAWHDRAIGDPTHKSLINQWTYFYFQKSWREQNKLTHGPYARIVCDFDVSFPYVAFDGMTQGRSVEYVNYVSRHAINAICDMVALVVAKK